ncbi:MAG: NUDIX hydrolase [Deltaproteobacteria bacterium HGW-Deltaproteobacteria-6]|nr:MAG: NUDIX hydrolase [Deltaproteobacteria bacterium HGW-Deltaproteobacteria-6]
MTLESARIYPDVPRTGVGAMVFKDNKILLVKRGVEPNRGRWAIPGGMLKLGETMRECAAREILEETGVTVAVGDCIYVTDLIERDEAGKIKFHFVVVDFTALYVAGEPKGADDAQEAGWFAPVDLDGLQVSPITLKALHSIGFLI